MQVAFCLSRPSWIEFNSFSKPNYCEFRKFNKCLFLADWAYQVFNEFRETAFSDTIENFLQLEFRHFRPRRKILTGSLWEKSICIRIEINISCVFVFPGP